MHNGMPDTDVQAAPGDDDGMPALLASMDELLAQVNGLSADEIGAHGLLVHAMGSMGRRQRTLLCMCWMRRRLMFVS